MGRAARWLRSLLGGRNKDTPRGEGGGEKKRSSFSKVGRHSGDGSTITPKIEHTRMREEQNKHAIAVAAATAAAADAAVAAAQAAAEVVRLTNHGFCEAAATERCMAVVKIQIAFRGFLAKKALRALKALVKLQALFRGYLVRKQAAATLHSMQALIRAQNTVRAHRSAGAGAGAGAGAPPVKYTARYYPEIRPRSSMERCEETRSEHTGSFHSRRLSASSPLDPSIVGFEDSPKIVEIDPGRPKSRNRRPLTNNPTVSDTTTDESLSSPLPSSPFPTAPASSEWCLTGDECRFSTAQSTPRFKTSSGQLSGMFATAVTPAKSVCYDGSGYNRRYSNPNYMSKTESFNAKVRSHSAPKQRPEPRKRLSLQEMVESRASLSGVGMMKSCSRAQEAISLKNTVVSKMTMTDRSSEGDFYLQRRW